MHRSARKWPFACGALLTIIAGLLVTDSGQAPIVRGATDGAGIGTARRLPSLGERARHGRAIGELRCAAVRRPVTAAHVELFARGHVVILPAGLGVAPPRRRAGAYVTGGRCRYPIWTTEPTGLVRLARRDLTLGDLFRVLGQPLSRGRMARWVAPVRAYVGGVRRRGDPRTISLAQHAQVVVQAGLPMLRANPSYRFPVAR